MALIGVEKVARSVSVRAGVSKAARVMNVMPEKTCRGDGGRCHRPGSSDE
jgi:hypothetical protein